MRTASFIVCAVIIPWVALSSRIQSGIRDHSSKAVAVTEPEDDAKYCCCKKDFCGPVVKDTSTTNPVYSPNYGLCCKKKTWSCGNIVNIRSDYKIAAPDPAFCESPQMHGFENPVDPEQHQALRPLEELEEGTPEHTVQAYCDFHHDADVEDEGKEADSEQAKVKAGVVKALVKELSDNSLDSMAKDLFSLYMCVRWAPTTDFVKTAEGEMMTEQIPQKPVYQHFDEFTFMPMRCTKNIQVYGKREGLDSTHFDKFEKEMLAQAAWYKTESTGVVQKRLENMQDVAVEDMEEAAAAFDVNKVKSVVAKCQSDGTDMEIIKVNTMTASSAELMADCAAAKWWLEKLEDWQEAMPFTSFMAPDAKVVADTKPAKNEQVIVCFGKRVASQLHRRANGGHLMTDQSMVGCHGFWDFAEASKMLDRIVRLWRPPTCQLAAMELDLKVKIMEMIARMNTQLFDALPAMLDEEASSKVVDEDGEALERAGAPGKFMGLMKSIGSLFSSMSSKYVRLGQMLGGTTVKWVVCPLQPITDTERLEKLDKALGSEDDLARFYAQAAYAKWTGKQNLLPGEECSAYETPEGAPTLPRGGLQRCSLSEMRENMPERYANEEFLCPIRPMLPAKQQLKILQGKPDHCPLWINQEQQKVANWFYRGRHPTRKQYDVMQNFPTDRHQQVKILDLSSHYDSKYYVTRVWATVGLGCTEEEAVMTPRFCTKPSVANEPSVTRNLLTGLAVVGGGLASGAGVALQAAGVKEATPPNKAYKHRLAAWFSGKAKSSEQWIRASSDALVGRASGRYERQHARGFKQVEANELVHGISFQSRMADTGGDSLGNKRFDRFAVISPCTDFDPNREFRLKYSWSEKAMTLARKGFQKADSSYGTSSGAVALQLRSDAVLRMEDAVNAWVTYAAHFRTSNVGAAWSAWQGTENPHILDLAGIFDGHADKSVSVDTLLGFQVTYACGTRKAMHDLDLAFTSLAGNFRECVKAGATTNEKLRTADPTKPFHPDEVVIRVQFKAISACEKDVSASMPEEEKVNPVYNNFAKISGCTGVGEDAPATLKTVKTSEATYRGMLFGAGLPEETLTEVLVDPADFLQEVSLK